MTPTIKEEALNTELQELYLITKQWAADLQFIHDESDIIKNLSHKPPQSEVIKEYLDKFNAQENILSTFHEIKNELLEHIAHD